MRGWVTMNSRAVPGDLQSGLCFDKVSVRKILAKTRGEIRSRKLALPKRIVLAG